MRLINFGQKKDQILRARAIAERARAAELDLMTKRRIVVEETLALANEAADMFDLSAYSAKADYAKEFVLCALLGIEGGADLFDEVEVTALQRAFLLAIESKQLAAIVIEQKWRDT